MRYSYPRNPGQTFYLRPIHIARLELEDNLDSGCDKAHDDIASNVGNHNGGKDFTPDIPHVHVDGLGLFEHQHNNVDPNGQREHEKGVWPSPRNGRHTRPAPVYSWQGETSSRSHRGSCIPHRGHHVTNQ